ncbi:MAG TPA: DUF475 domain-containing protein, partial [Leptolyngbyaceae cyanobacterium M65_K2018_010]|nr:DUF475 domain-containing protein [Leptolyngbyaceae cyanobacterium M65_K2018_010]
TATWVLQFWQFEVLGAAYLLWLVFKHFTAATDGEAHHHGPRFNSLWQAIPIIAFTDLAFSLDSVTTALALSKEIMVILLGGAIGVLTLRFMAGLFIRWLEEFEYLEDAGFVTVAFVGLRLLVRVIDPALVPPEWVMVTLIALVFAWGFSKRTLEPEAETVVEELALVQAASPVVAGIPELEHHATPDLPKLIETQPVPLPDPANRVPKETDSLV